jgi:hypothetical protein
VVTGALLLGLWAGRLRLLLGGLAAAAVLATALFWPTLAGRFEFQFGDDTSGRNPLVAESVAYRFKIWKRDYLPALAGRWLAGYGPEIPPEVAWKATESQYVALLLRGGLPLLALYGALFWGLALRARELLHHPEVEQRVLARVLGATLVVLLPMQLVYPYFTNSGLPQLLWLLPALLVAPVDGRRTPLAARSAPARP